MKYIMSKKMNKEQQQNEGVSSDNKSEKANNVFTEVFGDILNELSGFRSQITMLQNKIRGLEKSVQRKMRSMEKEAKKGKNKGNRKPSGFAVPTKISDDLCDFMQKPHGSEVARTEVTKYIINYISENKLQWDENHKIIKPDAALKSLLDVKPKDEVTYFNLQKYMNRHFKKE